jgi:adenylate cyclase
MSTTTPSSQFEPLAAPPGEPETAQDVVQALSDWIIECGLSGSDLVALIGGLCERLLALDLPLQRGHVSMAALHPSFEAFGCTWRRGEGVQSEVFEHGSDTQAQWRASPLHHMIERGQTRMRRRLDGPDAKVDFPVLREFREQGGSDWLALLLRFGNASQTINLPGMVISWVADRPGGFTEQEVALIERLAPRLGLACYRIALQQVAEGLLDAYVGADAGQRILRGQIQRGAAERLSAAIFFADLRGFTGVADRLPGERLLAMLNDRLGAITDAVEAHGGQVLKFLGDGLLGVFSLEGRPVAEVCGAALAAAEDALAANAVLQRRHGPMEGDALELDIALHLGEVLYGNVGSKRRLDFTVIGPAVNEVSRIETLCATLGRNLLLSERFARACGREVEPLGEHRLRGVAQPQALFTLATKA